MIALTSLRSIPVHKEQEILRYMIQKNIVESILVYTKSGNRYSGVPVHLSEEGLHGNLVLMLGANSSAEKQGILYLDLHHIEAIQFPENEHLMDILSMGKIFLKEYGTSGKLEVLRNFKEMNSALCSKLGTSLEGPILENLPEDKKQLDRIRQISNTIQQLLEALLSESDAKESWEEKIKKIVFKESEHLSISIEDTVLIIAFPYTKLTVPEISNNEFKEALLQIL